MTTLATTKPATKPVGSNRAVRPADLPAAKPVCATRCLRAERARCDHRVTNGFAGAVFAGPRRGRRICNPQSLVSRRWFRDPYFKPLPDVWWGSDWWNGEPIRRPRVRILAGDGRG